MESKPNTIVASTTAAAAAPAAAPCNAIVVRDEMKPPPAPIKKKRGAMHLLRAALFMIRRGSGKKSKTSLQIEVGSNGMLNKVVGSMRPLHIQSHESPLHEAAAATSAAAAPAQVLALTSPREHFVDVLPASPVSVLSRSSYSPSHSSTSGSTSRYASAVNLQELVEGDSEDEDEDEDDAGDGGVYGANGGDDMIDAKAEEFIAQFYQQMRAQNYNEMIRRRGKGRAP